MMKHVGYADDPEDEWYELQRSGSRFSATDYYGSSTSSTPDIERLSTFVMGGTMIVSILGQGRTGPQSPTQLICNYTSHARTHP